MSDPNPYATSNAVDVYSKHWIPLLPLILRGILFSAGVSAAAVVAVCATQGFSAGGWSIMSDLLGFAGICGQLSLVAMVATGCYWIVRNFISTPHMAKPLVFVLSGIVFVAVAFCSHFALAKLLPDALAAYMRNALPVSVDIALAIPAGLVAAVAGVETSQLLIRPTHAYADSMNGYEKSCPGAGAESTIDSTESTPEQ